MFNYLTLKKMLEGRQSGVSTLLLQKREQGQRAGPQNAPWYKWLQVTQNPTTVLPRKKKKGGGVERTISNLPRYSTSHVPACELLAIN